MNVESFLDYNQILKIIFEITGERVDYDFICSTKDERLSKRIIENLKNISSLEDTENPDICRLSINDTIFINLNKQTGEIESVNKLTSFETRLLAQSKTDSVPFSREQTADFSPKTDLHTHFAGAIRPDTLIEVGKAHNIGYPARLLTKLGIDVSKYSIDDKGNVALTSIDETDIESIKSQLMISPVTQETFNKMEEVYALRGPFTKNKELFPDYLRALAEDYKRTGVEYAELSFSSFLTDPEYMQLLEDNLPKIEEETGVKLRFLAGLWRHSDQEWNLDDTDRLMRIAKSPYIVGCDFMGHETNATLEFAEELKMLTQYASREDPNFAIRIHAGENPMFKSNVYDALKIIYDEHARLEKETGKQLRIPQVRIGHGLYGLDITEDGQWNQLEPDAVLKLAKKMGAIVEFNMSSNLALNNINSIAEVPIKRYIDEGIDVVLGTDGHGMYSTFGGQEALLATAAGIEPSDFEKMATTESKIIARAIERESEHPRIDDVPALYSNMTYSTPDGQYRYTKEVEQRHREEKENASKYLGEKIAYTGAITDEQQIEEDTKGKIPIMITGASKKAWPNILPKDQENIALTVQVLANTLNPETAYVITGGTNFGAEKTMHEAVHRRNQKSEKPLVLLGTFTMEAALDGEKGVEKDTITHATVLELDGRKANNWMDLPDTQLVYTQERNGYMIALGGGPVVSDMIQRAHNLGVDMHLMDGPYGASTDKAKSLKGNDYSFKTVQELLQRLYTRNPNMFSKEFSLENIETYIQQAQMDLHGQEMTDNPANFGLGAIDQIDQSVSYQDRANGQQRLKQELQKAKEEIDKSEVSHDDDGI